MTGGTVFRLRGTPGRPDSRHTMLDGAVRSSRSKDRTVTPPLCSLGTLLARSSLSLALFLVAASAADAPCRRRSGMVSWSDGSDSSEHTVEYVSSASDDGTIKVPAITEDSDFEGPETDLLILCHGHGKAAGRGVAFEGIHTGRSFLRCAEKEGKNCGLVEWIDPAWPITLENALSKLWHMYEESKRNRTEDNLMNSFAVHNLTQEKKKLQASYEKLVEDVNGLLDAREKRAEIERKDVESSKFQEKYDIVKNLAVAQGSVIRNMKLKLDEERKNLQIQIDELQKTLKQRNVRLESIKAIING